MKIRIESSPTKMKKKIDVESYKKKYSRKQRGF